MARFTVVVGHDFPDAFEELSRALSGEDVRVVLDRRARSGPETDAHTAPARGGLSNPCRASGGARRSSDPR
jgi:hypothetical protein